MSRFGDRLKKMLGSYYSMGSSKDKDAGDKKRKKGKRWRVVIPEKYSKTKKDK